MKLATWNVNSIRARWTRFSDWLRERQPDVVCIQETKVEDGLFPFADIESLGYRVVFHGQKTYNGVAILARQEPTDVVRGFGDGVDDSQARFIAATVGGIRVASVYVPNGQAVGSEKFVYKLAWLARLRSWLDAHTDRGSTFFLCGDFNVAPDDRDVYDPEGWRDQVLCHPDERAALIRVQDFGLDDLFRRHHAEPGIYSWWDYRQLGFPKNRGLRIDHIFGTPTAAAICGDVIVDRDARKGQEPSDHAPVVATLNL